MMFVHYNNKIINANSVEWIDYSNLPSRGYIKVYCRDSIGEVVDGPAAFDVLMRLCPEALEGKNLKEQRGRWAVHNFLGHPLMQIFSWLGFKRMGLKIHDATVPNPITK